MRRNRSQKLKTPTKENKDGMLTNGGESVFQELRRIPGTQPLDCASVSGHLLPNVQLSPELEP